MLREQKGITLVALVITIIVLLILAGVTIAALSGDNGILTNASKSQQENALGNAKDIVAMAINEATNAYYNSTYLNETNSKVVAGDQQATAEAFINDAKSQVTDATITITNHKVVIKTTDKKPVAVNATISSTGGLSAWQDGE